MPKLAVLWPSQQTRPRDEMNEALKRLVWERAENTCEYCGIPQWLDVLPFQIDHIIAEQHRGVTIAENLALSCLNDNLHKGPNIAGLDPDTGMLTRLFHPRQDDWVEHFVWVGPVLIGQTTVGRTTIDVLAINAPERVELRRLLIRAKLFPDVHSPSG